MHAHPGLLGNSEAAHLHVHDLLDLFGPCHDGDDPDGDDPDADAVDLSDMALSAAPPLAVDAVALDLSPVAVEPAFGGCTGSAFPVGLPPSTAGPHRPLYLTLCTLTI